MIKYGEITGSENNKSVIRIYKEKRGELYPTSLTLTAKCTIPCTVGDMVEVKINAPLFIMSIILGYLLPFMTTALVFLFVSPKTDNILIIEMVILLTLLVTYLLSRFVASRPFFRRVNICTVTDLIELE